ncbi:MAG: universal stress protein UspA [Clostridiaceae bacterium]|nr:universal stress protein UspA [Clostridiaceae bacterium]
MNHREHTMVCVTQQKTCEKLIKEGVEVQRKQGGDIYVVHVAPIGWNILGNSQEGEALDYLFDISKNVGAYMTVLRSSEVVKTIIDFCQEHNIKTIVLGESREASKDNNVIIKLGKKVCKGVNIKTVATD